MVIFINCLLFRNNIKGMENKIKSNYKILVIGGYSFDGKDATSITMKSLLGYLGPDRIRFITTQDTIVSDQYKYKRVALKCFNFNKSKNKLQSISEHRSPVAGTVSSVHGIKNKLINYVYTLLLGYRSFIGYKVTKEVEDFIEEFQPDIIYSLLASPSIIDLCSQVANRYKIPVISHFMDDWCHVMFSNSLLFYPAKQMLKHRIKKVLTYGPFGLTISEKMADEYKKEYHKEFYPFMNCSSDMSCTKTYNNGNAITIVYIGGLHLNREKSICFLCDILTDLSDYTFSVLIYTSEDNWTKHGTELSKYPFVNYGGFVNHNEVSEVYKKADILLHVESFDDDIKLYTRLSVSTKIPEYLSCRKPIIAIGPDDIASIEYLDSSNAALTITSLSKEESVKKVQGLLSDCSIRTGLETNARQLYLQNHVQDEQRIKLDSLLNQLLKG